MLLATALLALLPAQEPISVRPTPFDRILELTLAADDPVPVEGEGPASMVEYAVEFDGVLDVWTISQLDLSLRVHDALEPSTLVAEVDWEGDATRHLRLEVSQGDRLSVLVSAEPGASGALELHLVASPETEATAAAVGEAERRLEEVGRQRDAGALDAARLGLRALVETITSAPGAEHSTRVAAVLEDVARVAGQLGDLATTRAVRDLLRSAFERALPADHPVVLAARLNLANAMYAAGELPGARALQESVLASYERTLPEDHPNLLAARRNLAVTLVTMGDLPGGRALFEAVLETRERTLPADHPDLLEARQDLAVALYYLGDLLGARALFEALLEARERTLPADHPAVLSAMQNLAAAMHDMGDLAEARALEEAVLEARERTLPPDHPKLIAARGNLARTVEEMGDLPGARALEEAVLEARERTLPEDHPDLLQARTSLALTMLSMGDLPGARALLEAVLEARERTLPEDHPHVLSVRGSLAATLYSMRDLPGARALQEAVLEACERALPEDHLDLIGARNNLALTMQAMDELAGARALFEAVLEARERTLPADHPDLLGARANLALTLRSMGDLPAARALFGAVLESHERRLPPDHPDILRARANLALATWETGDLAGARALVGPQVAGMRALVLGALALAPREAREAVGAETDRLEQALFLTRSADPDLQVSAFELLETMRMVAAESARALRATEDPEVRAVLEEAGRVRAALGDLASRSPGSSRAELTRLVQERDRLEREASLKVASHGVVTSAIEIDPLARALGEGSALVTYRRIAHWEQVDGEDRIQEGHERLLAHVLAADGSLRRIDLGAAEELEELVLDWRRALGRPLRARGLASGEGSAPSTDERPVGEALRRRLLDPVLAVLGGEVSALHVCADDLVFLVPLDALPFEEGVLGDRYRFVNEVSCARLVADTSRPSGASGLLLVGGVDYDAGAEGPRALLADGAADVRAATADFAPLPATRAEVDAVRSRFERLSDARALLLAGVDATKEALAAGVAGKRWVHVATHGWFESEEIHATLDEAPRERGWSPTSAQQTVTGMAPMLLCGLALSGANRRRGSLDRTAGLLTAEELCSLDLRACELAVLSACETNVGIRRAGQGIQSLQAALYAAGARSSITSLWKVDDAATRRLFELFYTKLWEERLPKAEALWQAKRALRAEGAPVRDWGAWVLTGDPD